MVTNDSEHDYHNIASRMKLTELKQLWVAARFLFCAKSQHSEARHAPSESGRSTQTVLKPQLFLAGLLEFQVAVQKGGHLVGVPGYFGEIVDV